MDELLTTGGGAEFYLATVTEWNYQNGVRIKLDGQSAPMTKWYTVIQPNPLWNGCRVVVMKYSGSYIVLGQVGPPSDDRDFYTSNLSEIAVPSSDFTISSAYYAQWGKVACIYVYGSWNSAFTATYKNAFTMVEGKRPRFNSMARAWRDYNAILYGTGVMEWWGTASAGSTATFISTYLVK